MYLFLFFFLLSLLFFFVHNHLTVDFLTEPHFLFAHGSENRLEFFLFRFRAPFCSFLFKNLLHFFPFFFYLR